MKSKYGFKPGDIVDFDINYGVKGTVKLVQITGVNPHNWNLTKPEHNNAALWTVVPISIGLYLPGMNYSEGYFVKTYQPKKDRKPEWF